jgi:nucleoside-diphosphate-sugar epimerase
VNPGLQRVHIVTGAAGFIGSTLVDRLLASGEQVVGVDCFRDCYAPSIKRANLSGALSSPGFALLETDLSEGDLSSLTGAVRGRRCVVHHLAAQPGVRASWGDGFGAFVRDNVTATQRMLEWASGLDRLEKLVFASSSSVYGKAPLPLRESATDPSPLSPYGVTKLAAEKLTALYAARYDLPAVSLRFFTVYGPRQRPDMAFHRFIRAVLAGDPIEVYGDGSQTRDFTFAADIVDGMTKAAENAAGGCFNLGGGHRVTVLEAIGAIERATGKSARIRFLESQPGDVPDTLADNSLASSVLGWSPVSGLDDGIAAETAWIRSTFGL